MAFVHGKDAVFVLDAFGGGAVTLSDYCDNIDFSGSLDTAETTNFGDASKSYIAGLRDATFSVSGSFDPTVDAHFTGILAAHPASLTFTVGPQGSTASQRKITGEAILTGYSVGTPVGDKVTWSADLQCTGDVTYTTF